MSVLNITMRLMGFLTGVLMLAPTAQGAERFVLDMGDMHYRGQSVIKLKQELFRQYGRMDLRDMKLLGVRIVAKSKHGHGQATLMVDGMAEDSTRLDGRPIDFHDRDIRTFGRYMLDSRGGGVDRGTWQIHLQGNIIVKRIGLIMEESFRGGRGHRPPRGGRLSHVEIGSDRVPKLVDVTKTFDVQQVGVAELTITAESNRVEIKDLVVEYGNGQVEVLYNAQGTIREGDQRRIVLSGRNIRSIRVTATSPNLVGSRGRYKITLGVYR